MFFSICCHFSCSLIWGLTQVFEFEWVALAWRAAGTGVRPATREYDGLPARLVVFDESGRPGRSPRSVTRPAMRDGVRVTVRLGVAG